jgi:hypothetical protein
MQASEQLKLGISNAVFIDILLDRSLTESSAGLQLDHSLWENRETQCAGHLAAQAWYKISFLVTFNKLMRT